MSQDPRADDCGMDCDEAIEHLYSFLDGELTDDTAQEIRRHLTGCHGCFGHFEFERAFLLFLEARCQAQAAPTHLRRRVFERILLDQAEPGQ